MTQLIAIDPGVAGEGCACASFDGETLTGVFFARAPFSIISALTVVVERPEYQGERSKHARIQDLMALAWEGAALAYSIRAEKVVELTPSAWKGSTPKPQQHFKLWGLLAHDERRVLGGDATERAIVAAVKKGASKRWAISGAACYPRSFTTHNLLDAVALGATYQGRL